MPSHSETNYRNLPPDLATITRIAQASMLAAAVRPEDQRLPSRSDVAHHEAGHVVGSALLGGGTRLCWIREIGGAWNGYVNPHELPDWGVFIVGGEKRILTPRGCIARALFCWAGPSAERERDGTGGLMNRAADLPELMEGMEALRIAITMARFPNAPPTNEDDQAFIQPLFATIAPRLFALTVGLLRDEASRIETIALKLLVHQRLIKHEIAPLTRGIVPMSVNDLFDELRKGLAVGPLPTEIPSAYLDAEFPTPRSSKTDDAP